MRALHPSLARLKVMRQQREFKAVRLDLSKHFRLRVYLEKTLNMGLLWLSRH